MSIAEFENRAILYHNKLLNDADADKYRNHMEWFYEDPLVVKIFA